MKSRLERKRGNDGEKRSTHRVCTMFDVSMKAMRFGARVAASLRPQLRLRSSGGEKGKGNDEGGDDDDYG